MTNLFCIRIVSCCREAGNMYDDADEGQSSLMTKRKYCNNASVPKMFRYNMSPQC
jgi:hypothetical protein